MQKFDYLIIGGGVAGTTAADTIRKNDTNGTIAIINEEPYLLYSRIMLSKPPWFLGKVPEDAIWLKKEDWYKDNAIEFFGGKIATSVDPEKKIVKLDDGDQVEYNKLLIATGVCARKWPVPGADKTGIFYLRTLDDAKSIKEAAQSESSAIVIGGGFISFEMADLFRAQDKEVTLVLRESYYWEPMLDETAGKMIEQAMEKGGVKILRNSEVEKVLGDEEVSGVTLKDGTEIKSNLITCGIGVTCTSDWIKAAGIEMNKAIVVNEFLETSVADIWAAGDIAEFKDVILDETVIMGNWANAQKQGQAVGKNMAGEKEMFKCITTYAANGFGLNIAFVGDVRALDSRKIVNRGSLEENSYGRLVIEGKELVGALLVNRTKDLSPLKKLIEQDKDVSSHLEQLSDSTFDLSSLL